MSKALRQATDTLVQRDAVIRRLHALFGYPAWGRKPKVDERFAYLARSICHQQLAGKAAATIWGRTVDAVRGEVTPAAFLAVSPRQLRAAGLSQSKSMAVLDLARHVAEDRVDLRAIARRDPESIVEELTQVFGVGRWTAEMFMLGALHHLDVWSTGDLGVRRGFALATRRKQLPDPQAMLPLGDRFRPYRSIACHYFWRLADAKTKG